MEFSSICFYHERINSLNVPYRIFWSNLILLMEKKIKTLA